MNIDTVRQYLTDARQAYQACAESCGVKSSAGDLSALLRAARSHKIAKKGNIYTSSGTKYEYQIHGSGYTFRGDQSGKETRFDIVSVEGADRIRFSAWELYRYLISTDDTVTEEAVAQDLSTASASESDIVTVSDGSRQYYYYVG